MAAEVAKAFQAFSFLMGEITALDTIGGFLTTRVISFVPVMMSLWVAIVAVGLIRGEEQVGALDMLLSTPHSRQSVIRQKASALVVIILIANFLVGMGMLIGIILAGEPVPAGDLVLAMLNIAVLVGFWGAVGLLMGQFFLVRRTASSVTGGLIFGTFLLNNVLGGIPSLKWLTWLLPFRYFTASKPLVAGRGMDWAALAVLLVMTAGLTILSALVFSRRDIGSTFRLFSLRSQGAKATGGSERLLKSVFSKSTRDLLGSAVGWSAGLGLFALMIVTTAKEALEPIRQVMSNTPLFAALFGNITTYESYISIAFFTYFPVLLVVFSITQVGEWSSEEEEGRMELTAAMPLPRWQLIAARYVGIVLSLLVMLLVIGASLILGAAISGISLDPLRVWQALAASLPVALVVAAFGLCIATWLKRPGAAMPITIAVVVAMFFLELFAPFLGLPEAALNLSIFHLYGKPMVAGIEWGGMLALIAAILILGAGSLIGLNRRDIAK